MPYSALHLQRYIITEHVTEKKRGREERQRIVQSSRYRQCIHGTHLSLMEEEEVEQKGDISTSPAKDMVHCSY